MDEQTLGQLLLTGVPGKELDPKTARRFRDLQPGGFILFGRNIESAPQLRKLIDDLRDVSDHEPIITIDQEGGRVSRLRLIGQEPPSAQQLRDKGDPGLIEAHGRLTGELLRLFGFNLDLCPVVDVSYDDEADNSLRGRTYGRSTDEVVSNASIFNSALRKAGILSCGKHFPSYSQCEVDPHHELPVIEKTVADLDEDDLVAYRTLGDELDSVMVGHACYPLINPGTERLPASLSKNIITGILRDKLGYGGLVMTDDLDMGAILNEVTFEQAICGAVEAGNDLVMICHRVEMVEEAKKHLTQLDDADAIRALESVEKFKSKMQPPKEYSEPEFLEINEDIWRLRVDCLGEEEARKLSVEDGKRSPVELY